MTEKKFIELAQKRGFKNVQITTETIMQTAVSYINKKLDDYSDINKKTYTIKAEYNGKVEKLNTEYLDEKILKLLEDKIKYTDVKYEDTFIEPKNIVTKKHNNDVNIEKEQNELITLFDLSKEFPLIKTVELCYVDTYQETQIINNKNLDIKTSEHTYNFIVCATAEKENESAYYSKQVLVADKNKINYKEIVIDVLNKAVLQVKKSKLETKKYNIILDSNVMTTILDNLKNMLSAQSVRMKISCLNEKLNKKIFSNKLNIVEEPLNEKYPGYASFDKEGTETYNKIIIKNGRIETYLYNIKEAKLQNKKSTGNSYENISTRNMYIVPSNYTKDDLMNKMKDGLYITDQMGSVNTSINLSTGNISIQIFGYIVKDGKIVSGFEPAIMSTSIFELLSNIKEIGNDLNFERKDVGAPSIYVENISIASE